MTFRGNYVPKRKKVNYKRVVPFVIVLGICVGIGLGYYLKNNKKEVPSGFTFCNMTDSQSQQKVIQSNGEASINLYDTGFFGDSLSFYERPYSVESPDPMRGKTIFLDNLCSNDPTQVYLLGDGLDAQIPIQNLEPGFYEIRTLEGFDRVRLTSETLLDKTYYSSTLNNERTKVKVIANKNLFNREGLEPLDKQYVYLEVIKVQSEDDAVDIVIDPNGLYDDGTGYITPGIVVGEMRESDIMYNLAQEIVTKLNYLGYRASLSRTDTLPINTHGENGRIHEAYLKEASYYIQLKMLFDTRPSTSGATVIYSNFSSNRFAKTLRDALSKTPLPLYDFGVGETGIAKTGLYNDLDFNAVIRETGGKYTGAGVVNETYAALNQFAIGSERGMQSLVVEVGYLSNPETQTILKEKSSEIVDAFVEAIGKHISQQN